MTRGPDPPPGARPDRATARAPARGAGARFEHASAAARYELRPRYSDQVREVLLSLLGGERRRVLDAGTGTGRIARALVELMVELIERMTGRAPVWRSHRLGRRLLEHDRFAYRGAVVTGPLLVEQPLDLFVACQHSRQTWCLEAMGEELAREHDDRLRALLAPHADGRGELRFRVRTRVEWGSVRP